VVRHRLAYDIDTLALPIDDVLVGVTAFPVGATAVRTSAGFVMGVHPDLVRWPLRGEVAALQVLAGIPEGIEAAALDDTRGGDEWRIRLKENTLLPAFGLGAREGDLAYDAVTASTRHRYRNATIAAASGYPAAFEMHGDIRTGTSRGRWARSSAHCSATKKTPGCRAAGAACWSGGDLLVRGDRREGSVWGSCTFRTNSSADRCPCWDCLWACLTTSPAAESRHSSAD
jgi:hypothetical protein